MPVPLFHRHRYIYHFTHIDNLPSLLGTGFLANNHLNFPQDDHTSIAAQGIQDRRAGMKVPCGPGGVVHDYVPLYFGSVSLMLLGVINKKNIDQMDILYFEYPISLIEDPDVVFTDASANTIGAPNFYSDPADLAKLNWTEIDSLKWSCASDNLRHQRMAEALVYRQLPLTKAARCVVWNQSIKDHVNEIVMQANVPFPPLDFEHPTRRHWFNNFMDGQQASLVKGPREIAIWYQEAREEIEQKRGKNAGQAPFPKVGDLLKALRMNFGCLPHTAELVGLQSDNGRHKHTVDVHTKQVVENLRSSPEYHALDPKVSQPLVQLAAYLHDIGKGPKSRWVNNGGRQRVDPDHPVRAMPMMVEILTEQVGSVKLSTVRTLCKLVCYHDIVGEVLGKGRNEQQIVDAIDSEDELNMLFALSKADITALDEEWWDENAAQALYDRCLEAIKAK